MTVGVEGEKFQKWRRTEERNKVDMVREVEEREVSVVGESGACGSGSFHCGHPNYARTTGFV